MIIDSHTHNFEHESKYYSPEDLISSMDEAGIDYSLLIADGTVGGTTSAEEAIKICEKYPRLKAIGNFEYSNLDRNKRLIEYLNQGKIHGVKFYPGYENFFPQDEKIFPFYEQCEKLGKPVIFHTGLLMEGLSGLLRQVQPLNIDDVANKFPNLKIVMAHFGNPWIIDTVAVLHRNKNVYIDLSGYFEIFKPIPKKDIRYLIQDITFIKNWVGFKKMLFGTDWPLYSQKEYLGAVKQIPMTTGEKDLVLWKNAKEVFNLKI